MVLSDQRRAGGDDGVSEEAGRDDDRESGRSEVVGGVGHFVSPSFVFGGLFRRMPTTLHQACQTRKTADFRGF